VDQLPLEALRAWAVFDGTLRAAIHRLKYQRDLALGEILARNLLDMLQIMQWPIDRLSRSRWEKRGWRNGGIIRRHC
jgi:predicted amidophosphoribosyltransferase